MDFRPRHNERRHGDHTRLLSSVTKRNSGADSNQDDGWILYITNHFTHPILEAQQATPRYHLARALARKGAKLIMFSPLGRVTGRPLTDLVTNLWPKRYVKDGMVYLFPPTIRNAGGLSTGLSLVLGTLFVLVFLAVTRTKVRAQYGTTVLVSAVGVLVKQFFKTPLVANYGDPDYAREFGFSRRALKFCEDLVMTRKNAYCMVYADEVIGKYVTENFPVDRAYFLPSGGYEPLAQNGIKPDLNRGRAAPGTDHVVIYAGQLSPPPYRVDLIVPVAERVSKTIADVKFIVIGDGSELPSMRDAAKRAGLESRILFLGPRPYPEVGWHIATSNVGLQLTDDICMGTKVMLYMVHRKPVLSTGRWYAQYGSFLKSGKNCILTPPDPERVSEALIQLLTDSTLSRSIGEDGWKTIEPYTWDRHAEAVLNWLNEAKMAGGVVGS